MAVLTPRLSSNRGRTQQEAPIKAKNPVTNPVTAGQSRKEPDFVLVEGGIWAFPFFLSGCAAHPTFFGRDLVLGPVVTIGARGS